MKSLTNARAIQLHNVIRQAGTVGMLLVLPALGLTTTTIGNFEALRLLGFWLSSFWLSGLTNSFLQTYSRSTSKSRWSGYYGRYVLLLGLVAGALLATGSDLLGALFFSIDRLSGAVPYALYLLGIITTAVLSNQAIAAQRAKLLLTITSGWSVLQLLVVSLPLLFGYPFSTVLWGLGLLGLLPTVGLLITIVRNNALVASPPVAERSAFWSSSRYLTAYGAIYLLVAVADYRILTFATEGSKTLLAVWRYGAQELPLIAGIVAGMATASLAESGDSQRDVLDRLRSRSRRVNRYLFPVACLLMAGSRFLFPLAFGQDFYASHLVFNTLLLIVPSRLLVTDPMIIRHGLQKRMFRTAIAEVGLNIALSLLLFSLFGLVGVALGTVLANWFERLVYARSIWRRGVSINAYTDQYEWLIGGGLLLILYAMCTDFTALP